MGSVGSMDSGFSLWDGFKFWDFANSFGRSGYGRPSSESRGLGGVLVAFFFGIGEKGQVLG